MRRVVDVKVLPGFALNLKFDDDVSGVVDLTDLSDKGVFSVWSDRRVFEQVRIGTSGELVWADKIDLCPDALYLRITGKRPQDVFPMLRNEVAHSRE